MRNNPDTSLTRFLMIISMVLLAVLEYLWLHNEYESKYRAMEEKLNHVLLTTVRDVEDSLLFSRLPAEQFIAFHDSGELKVSIDLLPSQAVPGFENRDSSKQTYQNRHQTRGLLLKRLSLDTSVFDTPVTTIGKMVMSHIRLADSTGEFSGYQLLSWQRGDTAFRGMMSRPLVDVFGGKKIALSDQDYKADMFHALLPHLSFAVFLWLIVGAAFFYTWKNLNKQIQLNALRDEFVSNITHELKTPITTVGVALETLNNPDGMTPSQSRHYLDICQSELKRLSMLVERILHNRAPQIHYEKLDVRQVLDEVMHHMKVQFDSRNASIHIHQHGDHFLMKGDKTHMSGVLYNLLENSLKYSPKNPVVNIHLEKNGESIRIEIEDNGIGIDPDYHQRIFEKLYRVPQHNRHDVKGHGLGLSYVADVVKKHNGKIDLESEVGKGAKFSIRFPAWHEN